VIFGSKTPILSKHHIQPKQTASDREGRQKIGVAILGKFGHSTKKDDFWVKSTNLSKQNVRRGDGNEPNLGNNSIPIGTTFAPLRKIQKREKVFVQTVINKYQPEPNLRPLNLIKNYLCRNIVVMIDKS